jgi:hypothetical protein
VVGMLLVNLTMVHRAGREEGERCPKGQVRKDEDQHFSFPTICRQRLPGGQEV